MRSWIPTRVVSLAGNRLDECRRRVQRETTGRRGRKNDPLHRARRTLLTGADLLTDAQAQRLENLFADERNAPVKATWGVHQRLTPGLPRPGPGPGGAPDATAHQLPEAGRPRRAGGDHRAGPDPDRAERRHPGPLRSSRLLQRPHAKRSTDASSTCAASPRDLRNLTSCTIRSLIHAGRLKDHLMATA